MRRLFAKAKRQADKELGTTSDPCQPIFNGGTPCGADALEWRNGDVAVSGLFDRSFTFHLYSSPRGETVIIRLCSLSAYHRLTLPGLTQNKSKLRIIAVLR